jgi:predicted AAA+ superfamily ATPase
LSINGINDKGRLMENLVFIELLRRNFDIAYYQNIRKQEVDFVIKEGKRS